MTTVYVSGPMTGIPEHNFPAFQAATTALQAAGFDVLDPSRHGSDPAFTWADYLRRDLADVLECDMVAVLPGWESSRGAQLEVHVARFLEMPCVPFDRVIAGQPDDRDGERSMRLAPRTREVSEWAFRNFGPHDAVETVLGLAEEAGELSRAALKRHQGIRGTHAEWTAEVRKEVGDVVIKAHDLAGVEGFDLDDAVAERWAEVRQRDWKADPIGHGLPAEAKAGA